jgi:threonine/homoserine/homoserine lactone efflux protein
VPHLAATVLGLAAASGVFVVYGFVAHAFRKLVIESEQAQRWLRGGFAAAFAGQGIKLAGTER